MAGEPTALIDLLSALLREPGDKAAVADDPASWLAERGHAGLDPDDLALAVDLAADNLPAPVALELSHLETPEGLRGTDAVAHTLGQLAAVDADALPPLDLAPVADPWDAAAPVGGATGWEHLVEVDVADPWDGDPSPDPDHAVGELDQLHDLDELEELDDLEDRTGPGQPHELDEAPLAEAPEGQPPAGTPVEHLGFGTGAHVAPGEPAAPRLEPLGPDWNAEPTEPRGAFDGLEELDDLAKLDDLEDLQDMDDLSGGGEPAGGHPLGDVDHEHHEHLESGEDEAPDLDLDVD